MSVLIKGGRIVTAADNYIGVIPGAIMVDDETLFKTMQVAAETGALVMMHAENGDAIDVLVKQALAEGKTEPKWHAATRPPITEGDELVGKPDAGRFVKRARFGEELPSTTRTGGSA